MSIVTQKYGDNGVFEITLNDPDRRNAMGIEMFETLEIALQEIKDNARCVLLRGEGKVFCAGFDMKACSKDIAILDLYIKNLSDIIRTLRRLNCPVVVAAHGAAIAGGCALLTGCDFIVGDKNGKYGYPVHQLGISPAVTIPTLFQRLGHGRTRSLLMGGEIVDGESALQIGLLSHLTESCDEVRATAMNIASELASKPPVAMRATKRWLNALDGSDADEHFESVSNATFSSEETKERLKKLWEK